MDIWQTERRLIHIPGDHTAEPALGLLQMDSYITHKTSEVFTFLVTKRT